MLSTVLDEKSIAAALDAASIFNTSPGFRAVAVSELVLVFDFTHVGFVIGVTVFTSVLVTNLIVILYSPIYPQLKLS